MPRGLGDNPLKREKKLRRTSSRTPRPSSSLSTEQASAIPSGAGELHAPSGARSSYNDVFFQRRPETAVSPAVAIHEETHVESPTDTTPEPATETVSSAVAIPDAPVEEASRQVEVASAIEEITHPVEVAAPVEEVSAEFVSPAAEPHLESISTAPVAAPIAEPPTSAAETTAESSDRKGFFGRIFGKWHK